MNRFLQTVLLINTKVVLMNGCGLLVPCHNLWQVSVQVGEWRSAPGISKKWDEQTMRRRGNRVSKKGEGVFIIFLHSLAVFIPFGCLFWELIPAIQARTVRSILTVQHILFCIFVTVHNIHYQLPGYQPWCWMGNPS